MSNKIKYGLKNVFYSVISDDSGIISYGEPKRIRGAVNISLTPKGEKTEFFADDMVYFGGTSNQGYEGSLEIALIPDEFRVDVLKDEIDANGALIENANAIPNDIALMFEFNGDVKANRHVFYNVSVARPNIEGETKTESIEPKTETLEITVSPAVDTGDVKAKLAQGQNGYETFFTAVYLKNAVNNSVEPVAEEFDKSAADDITLTITTSAGENAIKDVKLNGVSLPGVKLTIDDLEVTIDKSVFANLDNGGHQVAVVLEKGNTVFATITVKES